MTAVYIALLVGAVSASLISRENLRGIFWIVASQACFWLSLLYWDLSGPVPFLVAATFDAIVVGLIYKYGKYMWEKWLMFLFTACILSNFAAQAFQIMIPSFNIYIHSWTLYAINWGMILYLGSISGLARVEDVRNYLAFANWSTLFGRKRFVEKEEGD